MSIRRKIANTSAILLAVTALAGCQALSGPSKPTIVPPNPLTGSGAWAALATDNDISRMTELDEVFADGLAEARKAGFKSAIAREGELLDPDAALPAAAPTPGSYNCRTVTLGKTKERGSPAFQRFKSFFCYIEVEGDRFTLVKQSGSDLPAGRLYPDPGTRRMVFLGAMTKSGENATVAYGDQRQRDIIGAFERIGPFRWRLVMPLPADGGKVDITEFTPVPDQPE